MPGDGDEPAAAHPPALLSSGTLTSCEGPFGRDRPLWQVTLGTEEEGARSPGPDMPTCLGPSDEMPGTRARGWELGGWSWASRGWARAPVTSHGDTLEGQLGEGLQRRPTRQSWAPAAPVALLCGVWDAGPGAAQQQELGTSSLTEGGGSGQSGACVLRALGPPSSGGSCCAGRSSEALRRGHQGLGRHISAPGEPQDLRGPQGEGPVATVLLCQALAYWWGRALPGVLIGDSGETLGLGDDSDAGVDGSWLCTCWPA